MILHVTGYARGGNTWLTILSHLMIRTQTLILHWINQYKIQKNKGSMCIHDTGPSPCVPPLCIWFLCANGGVHGMGQGMGGWGDSIPLALLMWDEGRRRSRGHEPEGECYVPNCFLFFLYFLAWVILTLTYFLAQVIVTLTYESLWL